MFSVTQVGPVGTTPAGTHLHPPRGLEKRSGERVCRAFVFFPLFSMFNFFTSMLFLRNKRRTSLAGSNAVAPLPLLLAR